MKLKIDKKYLKIPISRTSRQKHLFFYHDDKLIFDARILLDPLTPDFFMYYDISAHIGKTFEIKSEPDIELMLSLCENIEYSELYNEKYRPQAHYTPHMGWLNDPNGLVFYEGQYHLFHQFNPFGTVWGNMHWLHSVSDDLLHWKQLDIALSPDIMGTMFSGSAIVDNKNVTGLKSNEHAPLLLFYTAAGEGQSAGLSQGKPFTQCMAYSIDGGKTFIKYAKNPIIENMGYCDRDPKVVYCEENDCYYLILYKTDNDFVLFKSKNLLDFTKCDEITHSDDNECPDLFPISADDGKKYWILMAAKARYIIGKIENDKFIQLAKPKALHFGNCSYAGQTFSNIPENDGRRIYMAWNSAQTPDSVFCGSMTTPLEFTLKTKNGEFYLCSSPISELISIYKNEQCFNNISVTDSCPLKLSLMEKAHDISLEITSKNNEKVKISFLGFDIFVNFEKGEIEYENAKFIIPYAEYSDDKSKLKLRMVTDTNAVELFIDEGEAFAVFANVADYTLNKFTITGDCMVNMLKAAELNSIWQK